MFKSICLITCLFFSLNAFSIIATSNSHEILQNALENRDIATLEEFLPQIDINTENEEGNTLLLLAVVLYLEAYESGSPSQEICEWLDIIALLISHGASAHSVNLEGQTSFDIAEESQSEELIALLNIGLPLYW